ncbi:MULTISPECIES: hypothetical protein [Sinorhizobium]|uniref:hypothetical protein n=1 Tax=Sinorhizobium TaxID=28105 RepID=UPI0023D81307|nr:MULTISPECIES: hypothetical protein [unclassified Sinorhizobium]WEJ09051.1 hypothetical protein N0Q90_12945 [Sinorhizobium sp. M103]WEJ16409.1 hypothetical protein N0Q91_07365 [Sinorhizobium sp. K101]WEJ36011.1 hypothetical protein N0R80_12920 [Sinorhizobium sp. C101]GCA52372.1 hypothetical protein KGO5_04837 [Sinorhizobium sp. KGO-5]
MSPDNKPDAEIRVEKRTNGRWAFVLSYRGVTYPAQGQFATQLQAQSAAYVAVKLLRKTR